jgi:hypothetical protein
MVIKTHWTVNQLQVEVVSIENRRTGHPELDVEFSKGVIHISLPDLVPIHREATQDSRTEETPDVLTVG